MNEKMGEPDLRFKEFEEPWREVMIGEICEVERSRDNRVTAEEGVTYPYYSRGPLKSVDWYEFEGGCLVVGIERLPMPHLCAYWVDGRFGMESSMCVLRARGEGVNMRYLKYAMEAVDARQFVMGSVVERLSVERLLRVGIMLPRIEEQDRIVAMMEGLEKWSGLSYENVKMEVAHMRYALLRNMVTVQTGAEYPQLRFPEFGDKWRLIRLGDFVRLYNGSMGRCEVMKKGGEYSVPLYSMVNRGDDEREIAVKGYVKREPKSHEMVPKGSVVWDIFIERCNMNKMVDRDCKLDRRMLGVKADNEVCSDEYLYYVLEALDKRKLANGTLMIWKKSFVDVRVAIPCDKDEQGKIVRCMEAMDGYIDELNKKNGKMSNLCKHVMGMMLKCNHKRREVRDVE